MATRKRVIADKALQSLEELEGERDLLTRGAMTNDRSLQVDRIYRNVSRHIRDNIAAERFASGR